MQTALSRVAPAKINLTLHVTGQRADGYHLLDSLVVFTKAGDQLSLSPDAQSLSLDLTGPRAGALAVESDNLVLRAARAMGVSRGAFTLDKRLPVASGMGGGSSDAAAALHLLAEARGLPLPDTEGLMALGADLPVCVQAPAPARMRGLGEQVQAQPGVPALWLLLVNDGEGLSTPAVFRALSTRQNLPMLDKLPRWDGADELCDWLKDTRNDLQPPAIALMPGIAARLDQIAAQPGCLLSRMTGSGATCFGIFRDEASLNDAARALEAPGRFVMATRSEASRD